MFSSKKLKTIETVVNHELKLVSKWMNLNKLSLNTDKTKLFFFLLFNDNVMTPCRIFKKATWNISLCGTLCFVFLQTVHLNPNMPKCDGKYAKMWRHLIQLAKLSKMFLLLTLVSMGLGMCDKGHNFDAVLFLTHLAPKS